MKKIFAVLISILSSSCFASVMLVTSGPSVDASVAHYPYSYDKWGFYSANGIASVGSNFCPQLTNPAPFWMGNDVFYVCPQNNSLTDFVNHTYDGICIGGEYCGVNDVLVLRYPAGTYLSTLIIRANDEMGSSHKAHLQLWKDGTLLSEQDVLHNGSDLIFPINSFVGDLVLKSVQENHKSGGDETIIDRVQSY